MVECEEQQEQDVVDSSIEQVICHHVDEGMRRIFIFGDVTECMAAHVVKSILYLADASDEPMEIWLHSDGGDLGSAFTMLDVMDQVEAPVYTVAYGPVASSAALLFIGGELGHRYVAPRSFVALHGPYYPGSPPKRATSTSRDLQQEVDQLKSDVQRIVWQSEQAAQLLAARTHLDRAAILAVLDSTTDRFWLGAEAVLQAGMADRHLRGLML